MPYLAEYRWNGEPEWAIVQPVDSTSGIYRVVRHLDAERIGKIVDAGHYLTIISLCSEGN